MTKLEQHSLSGPKPREEMTGLCLASSSVLNPAFSLGEGEYTEVALQAGFRSCRPSSLRSNAAEHHLHKKPQLSFSLSYLNPARLTF